ncbi:hypothetical protein Bhyg_06915 [Pseudolycoriella hygida]|uniref:PPPDE domain-containing protein n=1 Tax=Pseudolycoriella hygida TaxID=35572 RepID=A0A9Q0S3G4_9DIPT|nr:hypothetical protein Bhyg_06915 [Pseudolycoriella hygida]
MSQSQVYLFLYEKFDVWKWITGQRRWYHAGVNLYGKEYSYSSEGILALSHANNFRGVPLKRTFTLAMTNISNADFMNKINDLGANAFSSAKHSAETNNSCHFARTLIMYLLEIDHLEPELEEYLHPASSLSPCSIM